MSVVSHRPGPQSVFLLGPRRWWLKGVKRTLAPWRISRSGKPAASAFGAKASSGRAATRVRSLTLSGHSLLPSLSSGPAPKCVIRDHTVELPSGANKRHGRATSAASLPCRLSPSTIQVGGVLLAREQRRLAAILTADVVGYSHAAYEQIYYSSLMPRTNLCARLLETLD
jgi:hypothetical protein